MSFGEIRNHHGERLDYVVDGEPGDTGPLVVIGHGLTSHHARLWLIAVSEACCQVGLAALRFSFAGNGDSEGRFEAATITKEVDDLGSVLDAVGERTIVYVGHSMGGAVGVLRTARDPRIAALVSLAGMVHVHAFVQRHFGHLVPERDVMLDKPNCPLSRAFLDDAEAIGDVLDAAAEIAVPWLIVHGTADEFVPVEDTHAIGAVADPPPEVVELAAIDHRYSGVERDVGRRVARWIAGVGA